MTYDLPKFESHVDLRVAGNDPLAERGIKVRARYAAVDSIADVLWSVAKNVVSQ